MSGSNSNNVIEMRSVKSTDAPGVYLWDINTDTVFSDNAAAAVFGFEAQSATTGLPISEYLSRMHPEDLPHVAKAIRDAIVAGTPYQEEYRICRPDDTEIEVMAFGTCFRDEKGEPSHYAGILFPKETPSGAEATIRQLCLMAYDLAKRDGNIDAMAKLIEVLATVSSISFQTISPTVLKFRK